MMRPSGIAGVAPAFIGEFLPAPVVQFVLDKTTVEPRKILILAAVSSELENASADTAAAVVGRVLADEGR